MYKHNITALVSLCARYTEYHTVLCNSFIQMHQDVLYVMKH